MDENTRWQKLGAEFLGTAFLVFVGSARSRPS
jgi:glycerol uptake facilitator-like aquaporin